MRTRGQQARDQQLQMYQAGDIDVTGGIRGDQLAQVLADPELAPFFEHASIDRLKTMQKEFFSEALGGPLFYSGHSLRQVHAGKGISRENLRTFVGCLLKVLKEEMDQFGLTRQDVDRIYSRIAIEADRITDDVAESG